MDNALLMCGIERVGNLPRDIERVIDLKPLRAGAGDQRGEGFAFDELEEERADRSAGFGGRLFDSIDRRDVWVIQ